MADASIDFETRSAVDLKKVGLHRYFEDETTEVLCLAWRIGDGPVQRWRPGDEPPWKLILHITTEGTVIAHNNAFDRTAWNAKTPWAHIAIEQCDCTMARGAAMALPQSLDQLGIALGASVTKDRAGHQLMLKLCKPKGWTEDGQPIFINDEALLERNVEYCMADVEAERAIDRLVPKLSAKEQAVWRLDQVINDRGVQVDVALCERALNAVQVAKARADKRMRALTQGHVTKTTEVGKIVAWLNSRGIACESIAKGEIDEIVLRTGLMDDPEAREVLHLRRAAAKSSTAKYQAILSSVCRDGRVRGSLRYHGASTGRWAGAGMQPQNFPRIHDAATVTAALAILRHADNGSEACDGIGLMLGEPMAVLSQCLRSMLIAKPGFRLIGGDYANIEGRVNAWLADEWWKLEAFAAYDEGNGDDLYSLAYARAFGIEVADVTTAQRQIGKVMELSMGFQGGWRAFEKMGANYGISVGQERGEELKKAWRDAHPAITQSWWDLQDAAIFAVQNPGVRSPALGGKVAYKVARGVLWCLLPSGRTLAYAAPRLKMSEETEERPARLGVEFDAVDSITKKWGPHRLYGGLQCENIVQAVARDILVDGMLRLEDAGYPLVLTVHDENISEMREGQGSADSFAAIMGAKPQWARGLPIAVKAWEDKRYVK